MATLDDLTTAGAKSLVDNDFRLTAHRGEVLHPPVAEATTNLDIDPEVVAPAHPSAVLPGPPEDREKAFDEFVSDLAFAAGLVDHAKR
jgi:uracil-DNA glycosylase